MDVRRSVVAMVLLIAVTGAYAGGGNVNLLANGGFEKDADGDGVADGWLGELYNFARETREEAEAYIESLPPYEEMLKGKEMRCSRWN